MSTFFFSWDCLLLLALLETAHVHTHGLILSVLLTDFRILNFKGATKPLLLPENIIIGFIYMAKGALKWSSQVHLGLRSLRVPHYTDEYILDSIILAGTLLYCFRCQLPFFPAVAIPFWLPYAPGDGVMIQDEFQLFNLIEHFKFSDSRDILVISRKGEGRMYL